MSHKPDRQVVLDVLRRWEQWQYLYPRDYTERFFHLYEDELTPVLEYLKQHVRTKC